MVPVIVGATIDRAIVTGEEAALGLWLGVLVATFANLSFSYRFGDRLVERASETAAHDLRLAITRRILHPRGGAAEGRLSGGLLSIATSDASRVGEINADVAAALPGGLDATLGERGRSLSGGQRQRVALARALASEAPVLVLHDPTTAVDAVTEARIATLVRQLRAGRTTIVITSSPALLAAADRVVLIAAGRVAASGSHTRLLHEHERYRTAVLS